MQIVQLQKEKVMEELDTLKSLVMGEGTFH